MRIHKLGFKNYCKLFFIIHALLLGSQNILAQTTISIGPTGGTYSTISAYLANNPDVSSGSVILELNSSYLFSNESLTSNSFVLPAVTGTDATHTITIRPAVGFSPSFSSSSAAPTIKIKGGSYWIIDGRSGGSGSTQAMTIANTNSVGSAIQFLDGAQNNTIQYCAIKSGNHSTSSGTIVFGSNSSGNTGNNSFNTIDHCKIGDATASDVTASGTAVDAKIAYNAIYSSGGTYNNSNNTISANEIFNFYNYTIQLYYYSQSSGPISAGVYLDNLSNSWTISQNSFYESVDFTASGNSATNYFGQIYGIYLFGAKGSIIQNNFFGGKAASAIKNSTNLTLGPNTGISYWAMELSFIKSTNVGSSSDLVTKIDGNTIKNITQNMFGNAAMDPKGIINLGSGNYELTNNIFGEDQDANSNPSIILNSTLSSNIYSLITINAASGSILINNNTFFGIKISSTVYLSSANNYVGLNLFNLSGQAIFTIQNNTIGSNTNNSIYSSNPNSAVSNVNAFSITAFNLTNLGAGSSINSNIIKGIYINSGTGGFNINGIILNSGSASIHSNQIYTLVGPKTVNGINVISASAGLNIYNNSIYDLSSSNGYQITGIYYNGPTAGVNNIYKNKIHSFNSTNGTLVGIDVQDAGNTIIHNNQVRFGYTSVGASISSNISMYGLKQSNLISQHKFYYNTIYIGGAASSPSNKTYAINLASTSSTISNERSVKNNIFSNVRTGGTNLHYTIATSANLTGADIDYNNYWTGSVNNFLTNYGGTDFTTIYQWTTNSGKDASSLSVDPMFIAPTGTSSSYDLHLNSNGNTNKLKSRGTYVTTNTNTDIDGNDRSTQGANGTADIGSDEFVSNALNTTAPKISSITRVGSQYSNSSSASFIVTFTDAVTGVDAGDFTATITGNPSLTASNTLVLSGSGTTYTITVNSLVGAGILGLNVKPVSTGIINSNNIELISGFPNGETYIIDQIAPTIASFTSQWGSSLNITEASASRTITITTTGVENNQILSISLNANTYSGTVTNNVAIISIPQIALTNLIDASTYTITANVSDATGNAATALSSSFSVDKTAPTLNNVSFTSNGSSSTLARWGNKLILSFTSSEVISSPTVTISGISATATNTTGNTWTASVFASNLTQADGNVPFSIASVDIAGNNGTTVSATSDASVVTIDRRAPYTLDFENATLPNLVNGTSNDLWNLSGSMITESISSYGFSSNVLKTTATNTGGTGDAAFATEKVRLEPNTTYQFSLDALSITSQGVQLTIDFSSATDHNTSGVSSTYINPSYNLFTIPANGTTKSSYIYNFTTTNNTTEALIRIKFWRGGSFSPYTVYLDNIQLVKQCAAPTTQATSLIFSNCTKNSISNTFTVATGSPSGYLVVQYTDAQLSGKLTPTDGTTYTTGAGLGGTIISASTTQSNTVTGLVPNTQYTYYVYTFNNTSCYGGPLYNRTGPLVGVKKTLNNAPVINGANATHLTGTTTINSTVSVKLADGTLVGTVTSTSNGSFDLSYSGITSGSTLKVSSVDASGNPSEESSTIVDTQLPTLSTVTIRSNNSNNSSKAKAGDIITLTLTASESITTPSVTIAGQSGTVTGTGGTYTATYTVATPITEGAAAISITYSDLAGNAGTVVTSTTNSSTVMVDVSNPAGYSFAINQASVTLANQSTTSISLTGAEVGTTYSYSVNGASGTITGTGTITNTSQTIPIINVTSLPDGTLTYSLILTDASGNVGTAVTQTVSKDSVVPVVSSVTTTATNGNYKAGQIIPIIVTFSEPVTVTGTPQLTVETGTSDAVVSYASGSGTNTLTFNYTIGAGENSVDLNYVSTTALALNSGTINDLGDNPATLTLPALNAAASLGGSANIVIDTQAPSLSSVRISSSNANTSKAKENDVISVSITASESIATPTVTIAGQPATVTGTGGTFTATYTVATPITEGAAAISITYSDLAGNAGTVVTSTTNSSTVTVDVSNPTGYSFAINQASVTQANQSTTSISLTGAEVGTTYSYSVNGASGTITGTGTITNTSQTIPNINVTSLPDGTLTYSLVLTDASGNVGTAVTQTVSKDSVIPTVSSVTTTATNGNYKAGQIIPIIVTFSEPVTVTGTPQLTVETGTSDAVVSYASGSGTSTLTFNYTIGAGENSVDLNYVSTTALALNSGTINDLGNNPASLTLPALNAAASLGGSANIVIDTQAPSLSSVRISSNNANTAKAKVGDLISVSITASESIATPAVTIAGQSATVTGTGGTYTATYTVATPITEGPAAISITYSDLAGNAGTVVTSTTNSSTVTVDVSNPAGYSFAINQASVTQANQSTTSINLTGAEVGTTYSYSVNGASGTITGTGTITNTSQTIPNINVTSLPDGTLTYSLILTDASGNAGTAVTQTVGKDALPPTVSSVNTTAANGYYKAGQVIPVVVNFTEPVNVTGTPQITLITGVSSATTTVNYTSGSGTTSLTFNYTVGANATSADLNYVSTTALALNSGTINDLGNNPATLTLPALNAAASLGGSANIVIDTQAPSLSSVRIFSNNANTSKAKANDVISVSITASESIATPSVTIAGQPATVTGTGGTYTATYTVTSGTSEGAAAISITYSDLAGNAGTVVSSTTNSSTVTVDVSNPTLSNLRIVSSNANAALAKVGDVITLSLIASESIATPTVSIAGGTVSMTGSGGTYTATYTVTNSTPQGTASISVNFADISGNAGTTVTSTTNASSVVVDRTAPTMTIASNPANLRSGQSATLTFTISEAVSDFLASDITISGGSIGTLSGTGTTYTAEFTPTANSNANGVIDVAVNKFTDAAGNANTAASNTVTISIDNTLPTVTITSSTTALKAGETATITFTFSEPVLGFDLSDVTMNNGTFGTLSGTGSIYSAAFTPNANVEGTSSISIGATTFTDLAGNDNGVTASLTPLNIDTKVPSIGSSTLSWGTSLNNSEAGSNGTVTLALTNVENGRTVTVAVNSQTYTATVSSNAATITIPSSRLVALTDGGTYTVTTNVSDAAGNAAPAGTVTFTVDKTLPTITSVTTSAGTVINATEATSAATVTVNTTGTENGQVVSVVLNSQTYSATVSSNVATITIPASALTALTDGGTYTVTTNVSDAAANAANQNSFSISVDKTKPTTTISSSTANLKIGQSATLTITLSEAATDFVAGDITIAGGTIGTLSGTGRNYSATFTPTANYEGTASITLASNQFTDPNGNPNDESSNTANVISIAVDTKAPTMTIASNPANLRSGQTSTLTFTISESVSDFVVSDITISGGSIGTLSGTGTTYTAEFTPTANSNANGVIDVAVNKFTDAAGNANTSASNTVTISIDNTVPTVAITSSATALKAGETATITFTFSEAVLGFDLSDVTMNNGTLGTLSGTGSVYTAAFTPNTNVEGTSTISIGANTFTDLAGNNNAVSASLAPINIDTKVPSIGSSTLSWGTSLNSAETATNGSVTLALTNVENGRTVSVSVNSQTYTATVASNVATVIIPAANLAVLSTGGTYTVTTNVSDAAGNAAPAGTSTFTVDKTAPTLSSVIITSDNTPANLAKSGSTITLSITASESIQAPTVSIAGVAATVSGSGTNFTATYPVIATSTSGVAAILISYSDVAGNPGVNRTTTTNSSSVTIDRTAPSMTISSSASTFKIGSTATITFTASEATSNFIQSDVTVTGGTLTNWTAVSSTVYTATFTPNANTALNGNLSVAVSKFTDAAGNNNGVSNNVSFIIDTFRPTLALTSNVNSVNGSQTATINFTFNESVSGFTASDIVVTNGSLGALTGSGSAYSIVFTPAANFNGSATISVASNTFSDTVGNSNTDGAEANNTYTLAVDSGIPALSSVGIQSSNADPTLGNIGDVISINFVSTETVSTPIVTIDGQSAYVSGDGTNWTASYVVINGTNDGPLAFTIDYTDVAGNAGATVSTPTDGSAVSVLKNQTPVDNSTDITLSQDAPDQSINLLAGITDPEGDPLTISNVTITYSIENVVTNLPVVINSTLLTKFQDVVSTSDLTGTNLFIEMSKSKFLSGSQKGQINIAYVVTDGNNSLNANAVLNIIGANDQPTGAAVTLNQVVINGQNMGIPLTEGVGVSTNVPGIDPDDDSVIYTLDQNSAVKNGQFVFNPDGSFSFLPDANYYGEQEFDYYIKDQSGILNGPYKVKIIIAENPDIDGIPSKLEEVAPNGGDVNGDGIPDRKQNNITNVPLGSYADFKAGIDWANGVPGSTRPSTSKVGSLLIGSLPGGKSGLDSLDLDPNAKFRNVALLPTPNIANTDRQFSSDLYQFTIEGLLTNAADTLSPRLPLRDLDPARPGLQVRAVLEFPVGMRGSTYLKQNKAGEWKSFKDDQKLSTYDDGATLIDLDNDPSTIERIVLTFTDGAFGDKDTLVNNSISDPGGLGIIKPVIDDATLPTRAEGVATATALFNVFDRNSRLDVDEEGQKLYYTIDSTNNSAAVRAAVKIDSLTGVISVRDAGGFDYESFVDANGLAQFKIVVKATDTDGNFDLATYTQTITNVDEYPRIISGKTVSYREKQPTTVAVIRVQTLPDYQDLTSFSILSGLDGAFFTIEPATGVLRFKNSPNYDDKPVYTLDIQSQDLSGKTDHAVFTVNIIDIDADNDGILDDEEIGPDPLHPIDTDKDGIPDYLDTDSDGDGIPDLFESKADTDKDGIPDYLDTDSDGDGILDKIEAGPNPLKPLDSDGDGIPDFRELDADNDGYLDSYEKSIDTDKDGIPDFQDTDSDGDGILDKVEDDLDFGNIKDCDHDGIENRIDPDVCDLILPQIITPNGDGLNDVLKIPGIMRLQPNHITIINRWGAVVYDAENYQNTWGGTGDSGELPDGTYYYVVDFKGAKPTISNFIYLDRTGK